MERGQHRRAFRRDLLAIVALALIVGGGVAALIEQPGYTDAYYYFNAGRRWASGEGLTDPYLWVYINAPDALPAPSHTYWMPLESLLAGAAMALGGAHFGVAQVPSVLCYAALVGLSFWLGDRLGGRRSVAWRSGSLVLFSGFFVPFWTTTDTFAVYGLVGALALSLTGIGRDRGAARWFAAAGVCAGLAHLARADGMLLVGVVILFALWPQPGWPLRRRLILAGTGALAYLAVMAPWFVRNLDVMGAPLPVGGTQTIWLRGYNELVRYPPEASLSAFLEWGAANILESRWEALRNNLGTFVAVETWVVLGPFVLIGLWRLWRAPIIQSAAIYAAGLHLAMTLVFAYPGYRGGLFHSSSALLPFWAVASVVGLDAAIAWAARRRGWRRQQAQRVFGGAAIALAAAISAWVVAARVPQLNANGDFYATITDDLPDGARLIVNDPAALYYHTGHGGVVLPDSDPAVVPALAARYDARYLVLDENRTQPFDALYTGREQVPFLRLRAVYDRGTANPEDDIQVYEIVNAPEAAE